MRAGPGAKAAGVGVVVFAIGIGAVLLLRRGSDATPSSTPNASLRPQPGSDVRTLARVHGQPVTSVDVNRYVTIKRLSIGFSDERAGLDELCDRLVWGLEAAERSIRVDDTQVQRALLRRQMMIASSMEAQQAQPGFGAMPGGAMGQPGMWPGGAPGLPGGMHGSPSIPGGNPGAPLMPGAPGGAYGPTGIPGAGMGGPHYGGQPGGFGVPGMPGVTMPQSPFERATAVLTQVGLTDGDLTAEVRADLITEEIKRVLVYDTVQLTEAESADAQRAQQLRRERGAPLIAQRLSELRTKWRVERAE